MRYFKTTAPEDMSQGELSKRIHFLKCEEGGLKVMCEMSEKWIEEGRAEGEERKAKEVVFSLADRGIRIFRRNASWHTSKSFCKVFNEQIKEHGRTKQAVTQNQI